MESGDSAGVKKSDHPDALEIANLYIAQCSAAQTCVAVPPAGASLFPFHFAISDLKVTHSKETCSPSQRAPFITNKLRLTPLPD